MLTRVKVKEKDNDVAHATNAALRILTRREYSKVELYKKLLLKYTPQASKAAVHKCIENNWQSEERYTQMLFNHIVNQCYGPRKFVLECTKKGVNQEYYQSFIDETDWQEIAFNYLNKKLSKEVEYTFEDKQKILASLARRGFSNSTCINALNCFFSK